MGFLPEKDPETTVTSEQADVKKLPNRPPLPGEKLDNSQQLAMDVMAQVPRAGCLAEKQATCMLMSDHSKLA